MRHGWIDTLGWMVITLGTIYFGAHFIYWFFGV